MQVIEQRKKIEEFQSLLGFLMRCDCKHVTIVAETNKFQSLLGFLMRCDQEIDELIETE